MAWVNLQRVQPKGPQQLAKLVRSLQVAAMNDPDGGVGLSSGRAHASTGGLRCRRRGGLRLSVSLAVPGGSVYHLADGGSVLGRREAGRIHPALAREEDSRRSAVDLVAVGGLLNAVVHRRPA